MDEISELLREAKPLYFTRKKRNARIKALVVMVVCVLALGNFYPQKADYNLDIEEEMLMTESGSVIDEMGLPTDEYGLFMVS